MPPMNSRVTKQYIQTINAAPDQVFPLLCPVAEAQWLDGWQYEMIYSESGVAEQGCIFTTPANDQRAIWINTQRDSATGKIQFTKIIPGITATLLELELTELSQQTRVAITYTTTALSDAGREAIALITDKAFNQQLQFWEQAMNYYLETGQKLEQISQ